MHAFSMTRMFCPDLLELVRDHLGPSGTETNPPKITRRLKDLTHVSR
jgi:hypothetical protein